MNDFFEKNSWQNLAARELLSDFTTFILQISETLAIRKTKIKISIITWQ